MPIVIGILLLFVYLTLLSYYLIFTQINKQDAACKNKQDIDGISLIICAKNEYQNLKNNLPKFYNQQQVNFEIIVVNDCSTDNTVSFLNEEMQKHTFLKTINIENHQNSTLKGKRYALQKGIEAAKYSYVALSDADCFPASNFWLKNISSKFVGSIEIVLGYSPYSKKKGLLNKLIQTETTYTALEYLSFAKIGVPYMGVGRNLAYKKSLLTDAVFNTSNQSHSGDDDLIIAQIANNKNTTIQIDENSFVYSIPETNSVDWISQKTRHYGAAKHYSFTKKLGVGLFNVINILFYVLLLYLIVFQRLYILSLSLYLLKYLLFVGVNYKTLHKLGQQSIIYTLLFFDILYFFLLLTLHTKALFSGYGWKHKNR